MIFLDIFALNNHLEIMTKSILIQFCFLFVLGGSSLHAQVVINNAVFPSIGDTLEYVTDNQPLGISVSSSGSSQFWDFSSLQGPFTETSHVLDPSEGVFANHFPSANILIKENDFETYYVKNSNSYAVLGFSMDFPLLQLSNVIGKFNPSFRELSTPLEYGDTDFVESTFTVGVSSEEIPQDLLGNFPIQPDSLRLSQNRQGTFDADAWGSVKFTRRTVDVLRVRKSIKITNKIEAKVPIFGWVDVTNEVSDLAGDLLNDVTNVSYEYYSDAEIGPIAVVTMSAADSLTIESVSFIPDLLTTPVRYYNNGKHNAFVYPNPSMGDLKIQMMNFPDGKYSVHIYNILGKEVAKKTNINYSNNKIINMELFDHPKGTYLYAIKNANGTTLISKRFILMKP